MRIIVGVLPIPQIPYQSFWSIVAIAQRGHPFIQLDPGRTEVTRNRMAQHLVDNPEFTHLLMLDIDHKHPADIVERLGAHVNGHPERHIIGALCFRRGPNYEPMAFIKDETGRSPYYFPITWNKGLLPVDAVGFGAVLIAREVFEAMPFPWFYYEYGRAGEGVWHTEDVPFCERARGAGFNIYVDTATSSPHQYTDAWVTEETFRSYLAAHPDAADTITEVQP